MCTVAKCGRRKLVYVSESPPNHIENNNGNTLYRNLNLILMCVCYVDELQDPTKGTKRNYVKVWKKNILGRASD